MATLYYRAPKYFLGQTYGRSSDVWSTGITFVEVEQGHPPFQTETEIQLLHEIAQTVGGRIKNLDLCTTSVKQSACKWGKTYGVEFKALVDNMLAFDPLHRISSRAAARRSQVWWRCSRPLAGSAQPSSASPHMHLKHAVNDGVVHACQHRGANGIGFPMLTACLRCMCGV